ncbi:MAG: hypothetical protein LIP16_12470, partial [Clostridium sp.]|nr:hypothetical protein [Clostridium sp.]
YKNGDTVSLPEYKNGDTVLLPENKARDMISLPEYKKPDTKNRDNNITSFTITNNSSSRYWILYTSDDCNKTYGDAKQYQAIYKLLMSSLALIPAEDEKMVDLIKSKHFKTFCEDIIQRYAQASKTQKIIHPQKYMLEFIKNALISYSIKPDIPSKLFHQHSANGFHNFEQRSDIDYDALMMDNVKTWVKASLDLENKDKK